MNVYDDFGLFLVELEKERPPSLTDMMETVDRVETIVASGQRALVLGGLRSSFDPRESRDALNLRKLLVFLSRIEANSDAVAQALRPAMAKKAAAQ